MSDQKRRMTGFWVGVAFGLPYLYISQFINVWMLPGIPLFDLPIGRAATVILGTLSMGILGLIVAWEEESFWGILGGALFGLVVSNFHAYINSDESQAVSSFILFVYTFLPRLILYIPAGLFLRWVLNQQEYIVARSPDSLRRRVTVWLAILVVAVIGGRLSLYVPEVRQALKDADALVLEDYPRLGTVQTCPNRSSRWTVFPLMQRVLIRSNGTAMWIVCPLRVRA